MILNGTAYLPAYFNTRFGLLINWNVTLFMQENIKQCNTKYSVPVNIIYILYLYRIQCTQYNHASCYGQIHLLPAG